MSQSDEYQRAASEGAQQGRMVLLEQRLVENEESSDEKLASLNDKILPNLMIQSPNPINTSSCQ